MDLNKRFELIKRNTEEIVTEKELKELLKSKKKPKVYLGTAITGRPHIGYFLWIIKLADFLKAGFEVKLLLADLHGALDNTSWGVLDKRYKYYKLLMPLLFRAVGSDIKDFEIVKGSDFQLDKKYFYDVLKVSTNTSIRDCKKAASEVVKFGENPGLSGLIYPIMQALDEEYLGVDVQCGGMDQRKIFMFARENLPKIGYKKRIEILFPLIPGLVGKKMSASKEGSKVDLLDDEKTVERKINGAHCIAGNLDNGLLPFLKNVVMVLKEDEKKSFKVDRDEKYGGPIEFNSYEEIERAFLEKELHPLDLKKTLTKEINLLMKPVRKKYQSLKELSEKAYQ